MRPKPISERDCLRLVRVNGPSKMGLLLDCLARKDSGIRRSAGNDKRLLMSCCSNPKRKETKINKNKIRMMTKKKKKKKKQTSLRRRFFWRILTGDVTSGSEAKETSSDSPSEPIRGCSCNTPADTERSKKSLFIHPD